MGLAILFFVLGLILVILEVFFPSFGVLTLAAAASMIGSIVMAFGVSTATGIVFLVTAVVVIPLVLRAAFRQLPHTRIGKHFVLSRPAPNIDTGVQQQRPPLVDRIGTTVSELRPAGVVEIDGERIDVVTEGEYVEPGCGVRVVSEEGNRVVVEPIDAAQPDTEKKKPRWA